MGAGKKIEISRDEKTVEVRDYGRGIPLGKVVDCVSQINTGGKYNDDVFQFSVGLNGVGTKAVNALSSDFEVRSVREGKYKQASQHYLTALELDPEVFERKGESGTLMQERSVADRAKYYYYLATAYAHNEQWDRALLYLRKSLEEGYGNTRKILSDKNFEPMHEMPGFQSLVAPQATNAPAAD